MDKTSNSATRQALSFQIALLRRLGKTQDFTLRRFSELVPTLQAALPPGAYHYGLRELAALGPSATPMWAWNALGAIDAVYGDISGLLVYKRFHRPEVVVAAVRLFRSGRLVLPDETENPFADQVGQLALGGVNIQLRPVWEQYDDPYDREAAHRFYQVQDGHV